MKKEITLVVFGKEKVYPVVEVSFKELVEKKLYVAFFKDLQGNDRPVCWNEEEHFAFVPEWV